MIPFVCNFLAALLALPTFAALVVAALHFGLIGFGTTTVIADERDPARPSDPAPTPAPTSAPMPSGCEAETAVKCPFPGCDCRRRPLDASTTTIGTRPTAPAPTPDDHEADAAAALSKANAIRRLCATPIKPSPVHLIDDADADADAVRQFSGPSAEAHPIGIDGLKWVHVPHHATPEALDAVVSTLRRIASERRRRRLTGGL